MDTLTLFSKNLNQRSLTPRWPLTPCLLRSHVWLYPRIIVSKSHDNTSMYVDTVINFANYHIHTHTTYILRTYYVQNEWSHSLLLNSVQARQKVERVVLLWKQVCCQPPIGCSSVTKPASTHTCMETWMEPSSCINYDDSSHRWGYSPLTCHNDHKSLFMSLSVLWFLLVSSESMY